MKKFFQNYVLSCLRVLQTNIPQNTKEPLRKNQQKLEKYRYVFSFLQIIQKLSNLARIYLYTKLKMIKFPVKKSTQFSF